MLTLRLARKRILLLALSSSPSHSLLASLTNHFVSQNALPSLCLPHDHCDSQYPLNSDSMSYWNEGMDWHKLIDDFDIVLLVDAAEAKYEGIEKLLNACKKLRVLVGAVVGQSPIIDDLDLDFIMDIRQQAKPEELIEDTAESIEADTESLKTVESAESLESAQTAVDPSRPPSPTLLPSWDTHALIASLMDTLQLSDTSSDFLSTDKPSSPSSLSPVTIPPPTRIKPAKPSLTLVGAGPGNPRLLTLSALHHLHSATLVISDLLVPASITSLIPKQTPVIFARKFKGNAERAQREIESWILEALLLGHRVVRLKGGDPFVFGRGGEEILSLRNSWPSASGSLPEIQVVPGISASLVAPLSANIPVTHRGVADQVLITTGTKSDGSTPPLPPFSEHRTLVVLMGMHKLQQLTCSLINELQYPVGTEAAIVEKATCGDAQKVIRGTLEEIAELGRKGGVKGHATVVVGGVVKVLQEVQEGMGI
ncbi:hypothetical protein HDV05_000438 [Chytridiales sp. JEL 0842]|nr:hypothetical protein HDV05_000438 [Chytridiales sp. JEL 0842]